MGSLRPIACALLFLVIPLSAQTQNDRWYEVSSGNFRVLTDTSEAKGRRLLTDLEQRLATFQAVFGTVPARQFPIDVFLFRHNEDFLSSAPTGPGVDNFTNAYFVNGPDRVFVAALDKSPDDIANEVGHALGHVILNRMVMWHPFWLEEGAGEFFRKTGRNPDGKRVMPEDRLDVADILTIVPSSAFQDSAPAGPFRIQSYRLLRIVLNEHAVEFRAYFNALKSENGSETRLAIDAKAVTERLNQYTETRIAASAGLPEIRVRDVPASSMVILRGDLLVAARQNLEAGKWYEGDSEDARAARAILGKFANGSEAMPALERAARDLPSRGLVQFYFGGMESSDSRVLDLQVQALQRAVQLLPLMGRAEAELARVLTLSGKPGEAVPLLDRAVTLEPEFADRFYLLRAEALLALRRFDESSGAAKIAAALPHVDRASAALFDKGLALVTNKIQEVKDAAERSQVEDLRNSVQAEAARREPPKPPPPPLPPPRVGQIDYQYEATTPVEILTPVFPLYPDNLVKSGKEGKITVQVSVNVDGRVTTATVTDSQIPELNAATVTAVKDWRFRPATRNGQPVVFAMKLIFQYSIH